MQLRRPVFVVAAIAWFVTDGLTPRLPAAVQAISETYVGTEKTIQGNGGAGQKRTVFSLQVVRAAVYAGTVTALGTGTLVDNQANWVDDQFNGANGPFYVEFNSGLRVNIDDTVGTTKTLALAQDISTQVTLGAVYRIRPHQTLASVFGAHNECGLLAGQNLQEADNIILRDPVTQVARSYFYLSTPGSEGWYDISYVRRDNLAMPPEQGIMVYHKTSAAVICAMSGIMKEGVTLVPVYPRYNLVGTLKAAQSLKLVDLDLYTGDAATGVAAGQNLQEADTLLLFKPDGTTASYFYLVFGGLEYGWTDVAYQPADAVTIAAGEAFYIYRKPPRAGFYWTVPAE